MNESQSCLLHSSSSSALHITKWCNITLHYILAVSANHFHHGTYSTELFVLKQLQRAFILLNMVAPVDKNSMSTNALCLKIVLGSAFILEGR